MKLVISIDDGHILDLRAAELLEQYGFSGIFFVPSRNRQLDNKQVKWLSEKGHEIGGHTVIHPPDLKLLDDIDLEYELVHSKVYLEELTGKPVTAFCYPRGRFDNRVKDFVKAAGYKWARTTKVFRFTRPTELMQVDTSLHFYPFRDEYAGRVLLDLAKEGLEMADSFGDKGLFHLWFHSKEIEEHGLWADLAATLNLMTQYK